MRKAYKEYKATGIQWLPKIPRHWAILPLCAIAQEKSIRGCNDLPLLSVYLNAGVIQFSSREEKRTNVTSKDLSKYQRVDVGDFVLNNQQSWRGSVGVSAYTGIVSPAYIVLNMHDLLDSSFANYLFRSRFMVDQYLINSKGVGSIQRNIYWTNLKRIRTLVPPRKEQEQIVRFLDWKVSSINKLINLKQQEITQLKELKKATINDAVTHGLDKTVPMKDSGISWLGNIPKHWEIIVSKRLIQIANGCEPRTEGLIPVYGSGGMFKTCGEFKLPPAVLLGRKGTIDRPQYITEPYWNVDTAFSVTIKRRDLITLKYYYFCSMLFNYGYYMTQTALPSMTQKDYELIKIPLPPINEQRNIVNTIELRCAEIDRLIDANQAQIINLHDLKSSLIADVVTGQIDVLDVEIPDYEQVEETLYGIDDNATLQSENEIPEEV